MCEFCNDPNSQNTNRDIFHQDFAGFFSADAIEAAVRQAKAASSSSATEASTTRRRKNQRTNAELVDSTDSNITLTARKASDGDGQDDEDDGGDDDSDGT